jgi:hypothetical protein
MYQAMITTAAGLSVAIPAYLFYAILNARIAARGRALEIAHERFLQRLAPRDIDRRAAESETETETFPRPPRRPAAEPQLSPPAEMDSERGGE